MSHSKRSPRHRRTYLFSWGGLTLAFAAAAFGTTDPGADDARLAEFFTVSVSPADPTEVDWYLLSSLDYISGEVPPDLAALDGTVVKVPGFIVPLEDWATSVTEFLLVPYVGACIHTPPPPPNQMVYVQMVDGRRVTYDGWNPIWIEGTLRIEVTDSAYGDVGFRIEGIQTAPYDYDN